MPSDGSVRRPAASRGVVVGASMRAVRGPGVHLPVIAAVVVVASTLPVSGSYGLQVLLAVTVVLGFALQAAVDDPERFILAAAPCPLVRRTSNRLAAAGSLVLPVWLLASAVIRWHLTTMPLPALGLQALTLWSVAVVVAMCAWRASTSPHPSYVASPVFLGMVLVGTLLPAQWRMFDAQQWGPPWIAALLRWCAVLTVAAGVLALLLADPMTARRRRTGGR